MASTLALSLLVFGNLGGCAKHPVEVLQRQAHRAEKGLAKRRSEALVDDRYSVPAGDATAAAAAFLAKSGSVAEVADSRVGTDWDYGGDVSYDERGEYLDQRRDRLEVGLQAEGAVFVVTGRRLAESRRVRAEGGAGRWSSRETELDLAGLRRDLARLEEHHLATMQAPGAEKVFVDFERWLPEGFVVVSKDASSLAAERIQATEKENKRKGLRATWEMRETLRVAVDDGNVFVTWELHNRFSTEEGEGAWQRATFAARALALDWTADAMRSAVPAHRAAYGPALYEAPETLAESLSPPPEGPHLRTMPEIEEAVTRRAWESGKGSFTVCLDRVLVNPTGPGGGVWDVPVLDAALAITEASAGVVSAGMGELNALADGQPALGALADGGMAWLTSGQVDRKQAEYAAGVTQRVSGWTRRMLPVQPDISGTFLVGTDAYPLRHVEDSFTAEQDICHTADFGRSGPAFTLDLLDIDFSEPDPIGRCVFDLDAVANHGLTGVGCGYARAYIHATYNFSYSQIRVVGLPPA